MSELKPCPFCGEIPSESFVEYTEGCPFVKCGNEYCEAFEFIPVTLATWNSRPIESGLSIKISELEAHIAALEEVAGIEEWDDFPNFPEPPEVKE